MSGRQRRFFIVTAIGSAALGLLLGAGLSPNGRSGAVSAPAEAARAAKGQTAAAAAKRTSSADAAEVKQASSPAGQRSAAPVQTAARAAAQGESLPRAKQNADKAPPDFKQVSAAPDNGATASDFSAEARTRQAEGGGARQEPNAAPVSAAPHGVLNGYKGYRHHRPGYKSGGDGWWYPRAAFAKNMAGQKLMQKPKQAAKPPKPPAREGAKRPARQAALKPRERKPAVPKAVLARRHVAWCYANHPSYNSDDNSYRQVFGTKRHCFSPYSRKSRG